jgi:GNAT superfamily N-acetyltransferase
MGNYMEIKEIDAEQTWQLRQQVMWPGKDISQVILTDDASGTHYGLFNEERLVSVISVFVSGEQLQFRKFATVAELQGNGFGTRLLEFVLTKARQDGSLRSLFSSLRPLRKLPSRRVEADLPCVKKFRLSERSEFPEF